MGAAGAAGGRRAAGDAVERGVAFLVDTQRADGGWDEDQFTGTGFPGDFYINYHLYRLVFPISALGRYVAAAAMIAAAVICAPMAVERFALRRRGDARSSRTGMGPDRSRRARRGRWPAGRCWSPASAAGSAPAVRVGDVVVATEVRGPDGAIGRPARRPRRWPASCAGSA